MNYLFKYIALTLVKAIFTIGIFYTGISIVNAYSQFGQITVNESTQCATTELGSWCDGDIQDVSAILGVAYDDIIRNNTPQGLNQGNGWKHSPLFASNGELDFKAPGMTEFHILTQSDVTGGVGFKKNGVPLPPLNGLRNHVFFISKGVSNANQFGGSQNFSINIGISGVGSSYDLVAYGTQIGGLIFIGETNSSSQTLPKLNFANQTTVFEGMWHIIFDNVSMEPGFGDPVVKFGSTSINYGYGLFNGPSKSKLVLLVNSKIEVKTSMGLSNRGQVVYYKSYVKYPTIDDGGGTRTSVVNSILDIGRVPNSHFQVIKNSIIDGRGVSLNATSLFTFHDGNQAGFGAINSYFTNFERILIGYPPGMNNVVFFNNNEVEIYNNDGSQNYAGKFIAYNNQSVIIKAPFYNALLFNNTNVTRQSSPGVFTPLLSGDIGGDNMVLPNRNAYYSYVFNSVPSFVSSYPYCTTNNAVGKISIFPANSCILNNVTRPLVSSGIVPTPQVY